MRALLLAAFFTLLLCTSCGDKMQQLESAGTAVKQCLNDCSLGCPSVSDSKKAKHVSSNDAATEKSKGGDRIQTIWTNHLTMW